MKTKIALLLLIAAITVFTACKKSARPTIDPPAKKLKYLTQSTIVQGTTTSFIYYYYDDKNRLSSYKSGTGITTYTYDGDNLFSVEAIDPSTGYRQLTEFTYTKDGTISQAHVIIYRNNTLTSDLVYNYLVVSGRVTEIHHDIYVDKYTYDAKGNITNVYLNQYDYNNPFTFDDKPSIYTNGFPKFVLNSDVQYPSPNNVTTGGRVYTYGDDGYPVGAVAGTTKYAYVFTEM